MKDALLASRPHALLRPHQLVTGAQHVSDTAHSRQGQPGRRSPFVDTCPLHHPYSGRGAQKRRSPLPWCQVVAHPSPRPRNNAPACAPSESARSSSLERHVRRRGGGINSRPIRWRTRAHTAPTGRERPWGGAMPQTAGAALPAPCARREMCAAGAASGDARRSSGDKCISRTVIEN